MSGKLAKVVEKTRREERKSIMTDANWSMVQFWGKTRKGIKARYCGCGLDCHGLREGWYDARWEGRSGVCMMGAGSCYPFGPWLMFAQMCTRHVWI
jgi:hypothetical protein